MGNINCGKCDFGQVAREAIKWHEIEESKSRSAIELMHPNRNEIFQIDYQG